MRRHPNKTAKFITITITIEGHKSELPSWPQMSENATLLRKGFPASAGYTYRPIYVPA